MSVESDSEKWENSAWLLKNYFQKIGKIESVNVGLEELKLFVILWKKAQNFYTAKACEATSCHLRDFRKVRRKWCDISHKTLSRNVSKSLPG